ncbi:Cro/C1-type helix-turn-helix domain [Comamonadaceae bacterium]
MQQQFFLPFQLEDFGSRLAQVREAAGLSQAALAKALRIARYTQLRYEKPTGDKDQTFPPLTYVNQAHALGLDMHYVLTGKKQTPS